jgi:hypothetical protein
MKPSPIIHLILLTWMLGQAFTLTSAQESVQPAVSFRETIWIQTAGTLFIPGEHIQFHITLLEQDTYLRSALSRFARVELLDRDGNKLVKQIFALTDAEAGGYLVIPEAVKSGIYFLRAYTNWMRNFPDSDYPLVAIKIINPENEGTKSETQSFIVTPSTSFSEKPTTNVMVSGDTIAISAALPDPAAVDLRLLVHRSSNWYWFGRQHPVSGSVTFRIPSSCLPGGLVQFSILDKDNNVVASRLWCDQPPVINNIDIHPDALNYPLRTGAGFKTGFTGNPGGKLPAGLHAIVRSNGKTAIQNTTVPGLPGWKATPIPAATEPFGRWLSENSYDNEIIKGFFVNDHDAPAKFEAINFPGLNKPGLQYLPETRTVLVQGRVINRLSRQNIPNVGVAFSIMKNIGFDAVKTNGDGLFSFSIPQTSENPEYAISFISDPDSAWSIDVFPAYDPRTWIPPAEAFSVSDDELVYARRCLITRKLESAYNTSEPGSVPKPITSTGHPFYFPPDRAIQTDRYIELANVRELIYEVVPDVQVRKKGSQAFLDVYSNKDYTRDYEVLVLLDGIPVTDQLELLELPSSRIKEIEVRNQLYVHGRYIFSSIVSFFSRNEDFAGLPLPRQTVFGSIPGSLHSTLPSIPSGDPDNTLPDLNSLLLWQRTNPSGSDSFHFRTNDLYGKFTVTVCGFASDGTWYSGQTEITVTPPNL